MLHSRPLDGRLTENDGQIAFAPVVGLQLKAYHYGGSKHQWDVTVGDFFIALRVRPIFDLKRTLRQPWF